MKSDQTDTSREGFVVAVLATFVTALASWMGPSGTMPLDFDAMLWRSCPLAGLWVLGVAASLRWFGRRAFWLLLGALPALYWPVWLLFNGIPSCYSSHSCV